MPDASDLEQTRLRRNIQKNASGLFRASAVFFNKIGLIPSGIELGFNFFRTLST